VIRFKSSGQNAKDELRGMGPLPGVGWTWAPSPPPVAASGPALFPPRGRLLGDTPSWHGRTRMTDTIPRAWRWLTGDAWRFDPVGAGVRVPAITLSIAVGVAIGRPLVGVLAAGGAYTLGFGAPLNLRGSNSLLLIAASAGIGASATIGSLAAAHAPSAVVVAGAFGLLCGRVAARGPGPAWIGLQCAVAAVIATSYPASLDRALLRALVILAGGLAQTAALGVARFARRRAPASPASPDPVVPTYAVHLAIALSASTLVERALALPNGYWVPVTALLVLRPDSTHTMIRGFIRALGTLCGAALGSGVILLLHPGTALLAVGVAMAAFGAYVFQKASYGLLSACVTVYVVFLLSLAGMTEEQVAVSRIVATTLGGAVALGVHGGDLVVGYLSSRRSSGA
jgi:hypothetical protein